MNINKNDYFEIEISDIGSNGEGVGKIDNFTIFVENALPKETVKIKILKVKKSYGYGKLIEILKPSPDRVNPPCTYYNQCGGCNLQHLSYEKQLEIKSKKVKDNLERIGTLKGVAVPNTLGMTNPLNYRNKISLPLSFENELKIGPYSKRSHNIINIDNCLIAKPENELIIKTFKNFLIENNISIYNENTGKGIIRHIITKISNKTNEILICIVVNDNKFKYSEELINAFKDIKNLESIVINFNTKKNNVILGSKVKTIYGKGYITDFIKNLKFNISPLSFYQVNSSQTEILYEKILEFLNLKGNEIIFDSYCGIGTISLFLAEKAKKVYGIEIVKEAVENAVQNAIENNITNTEFLCGKSEDLIPDLIFEKGIIPDIVVVDPPRKGCEKILLDSLVKSNVKKIVYVSCDSSTLARDLKYLSEFEYLLEKITTVDMFCMSTHVETIILMTNCGNKAKNKE